MASPRCVSVCALSDHTALGSLCGRYDTSAFASDRIPQSRRHLPEQYCQALDEPLFSLQLHGLDGMLKGGPGPEPLLGHNIAGVGCLVVKGARGRRVTGQMLDPPRVRGEAK